MIKSGFGRRPKHKKFDYTPRYWDPEKEALQKTLDQYRGDKNDPDKVKDRISSGLRHRYAGDADYRKKNVTKSNMRIVYLIAILSIISYLILTSDKILSMVEMFEG